MSLAALILAALVPGAFNLAVAPAESLHVVVTGSGDPVVVIPGLIGSAYSFRGVSARLAAAGRQTVIIEPLAFGESSRPAPADYSLTAQARRVASALDQLNIDRAVVVGHTTGGSIGFRLAHIRPDLVSALISIEGGPSESVVTPGFKRGMAVAPLAYKLGGFGFIRKKIRGELLASSGNRTWVTEEVIAGYLSAAERQPMATINAFRAMGDSPEPEALEPHLAELRCSILILTGGAPHRGGIDGSEALRIRERIPAAQIYAVPGSGLFVQEEQPGVVVMAVQRAESRDTDLAQDNKTGAAAGLPGGRACGVPPAQAPAPVPDFTTGASPAVNPAPCGGGH